MAQEIPFVYDTHRMNYVGKFASDSITQLKNVLDAVSKIKDVRFLTTVELGEALSNKGVYADVFSGEKQKLTPKDNMIRKTIRQNYK